MPVESQAMQMDKTEKILSLQHYLHRPQHFYPSKFCDAPCTLLASERYTGNIAKLNYRPMKKKPEK